MPTTPGVNNQLLLTNAFVPSTFLLLELQCPKYASFVDHKNASQPSFIYVFGQFFQLYGCAYEKPGLVNFSISGG